MRSAAPTDRLWDVTSAWLQLLSPGVRPVASLVDLADAATLRFAYKGYKDIERDVTSREHRPSNVGFGLTYSLPIIVACLSAKAGALLLLENPEQITIPARGSSCFGVVVGTLCERWRSGHCGNAQRSFVERNSPSGQTKGLHWP